VFSSGAVGEHRDPQWEEPAKIVETVESLGAREHVVFGGRVPQDPGNFVERAMLRDTPPEVADLRDFDAIRAWASTIAAALKTPAGEPEREPTAP
jgi:menaquinone-dependent protoporphyrinogen oxidase